VPKTYPAYFGSYAKVDTLRHYLDHLENLFLVAALECTNTTTRTALRLPPMTAVDNIAVGITDESNLWQINTEEDYHEEKKI
jgi:hypothetical protein